MEMRELEEHARHNLEAFERVIGTYADAKLAHQLERQSTDTGWLDATDCVWCVFDDEAFARCGDEGRRHQDDLGDAFDLALYWSMGDVCMPGFCDVDWVADHIVGEAQKLLAARHLKATRETREVDGVTHVGVSWRTGRLASLWQRVSKP